ncbi:hypothetical protein THAOC_04358 [Thalassiosira oceanica]|uniref:Large ribosomal subunit protein mL53 n=1 Tax=Thalassiosira oceanica TaxID=159749 RepID=K0TNZ5_THAOC|nr:hypothetical protein THAOC_04358 [Thalassiosira oceanica]|eukprot:EJK73997.1 hypothetical protein THAOC_04358 [Thalassiosira oceanica]
MSGVVALCQSAAGNVGGVDDRSLLVEGAGEFRLLTAELFVDDERRRSKDSLEGGTRGPLVCAWRRPRRGRDASENNQRDVLAPDKDCRLLSITARVTHGHPDVAFDSRTRSAREVMRQFEAQRLVRANPKLKVKADVHSRPSAPEVKVSFVDGTDLTFDSQEYIAADMLMDIWRAAMKLDDEFELEGKNVEDVA